MTTPMAEVACIVQKLRDGTAPKLQKFVIESVFQLFKDPSF